MVDRIGVVNRNAVRFNVAPRYTVGSPALVREETALKVAREEQEMYDCIMTGDEGPELKARAQELGLNGIVEERWEFRGKRMFRDVITGIVGVHTLKEGESIV